MRVHDSPGRWVYGRTRSNEYGFIWGGAEPEFVIELGPDRFGRLIGHGTWPGTPTRMVSGPSSGWDQFASKAEVAARTWPRAELKDDLVFVDRLPHRLGRTEAPAHRLFAVQVLAVPRGLDRDQRMPELSGVVILDGCSEVGRAISSRKSR